MLQLPFTSELAFRLVKEFNPENIPNIYLSKQTPYLACVAISEKDKKQPKDVYQALTYALLGENVNQLIQRDYPYLKSCNRCLIRFKLYHFCFLLSLYP